LYSLSFPLFFSFLSISLSSEESYRRQGKREKRASEREAAPLSAARGVFGERFFSSFLCLTLSPSLPPSSTTTTKKLTPQTTYVKFHWKPSCGVKCLLDAEAERVGGANHSHATQDLFESIASGDYPEWQLLIQTMDPAAEDSFDFDPLDVTKIWPEDRFPLQPVGRMVLNKNPDNFFNENEMLVRGESVFLLDRFFFFRSSRSRFVVPPLFRFPSLSLSLPSLFVFVPPPLTPATSTPDGKTKNPKNRPSARRWSCPGSATRTTSCCRRASSPTPTRSVTGWAPTTCSSPPTRRGLPTTTTTTTGP
jgi:hypothetical protein